MLLTESMCSRWDARHLLLMVCPVLVRCRVMRLLCGLVKAKHDYVCWWLEHSQSSRLYSFFRSPVLGCELSLSTLMKRVLAGGLYRRVGEN